METDHPAPASPPQLVTASAPARGPPGRGIMAVAQLPSQGPQSSLASSVKSWPVGRGPLHHASFASPLAGTDPRAFAPPGLPGEAPLLPVFRRMVGSFASRGVTRLSGTQRCLFMRVFISTGVKATSAAKKKQASRGLQQGSGSLMSFTHWIKVSTSRLRKQHSASAQSAPGGVGGLWRPGRGALTP